MIFVGGLLPGEASGASEIPGRDGGFSSSLRDTRYWGGGGGFNFCLRGCKHQEWEKAFGCCQKVVNVEKAKEPAPVPVSEVEPPIPVLEMVATEQ